MAGFVFLFLAAACPRYLRYHTVGAGVPAVDAAAKVGGRVGRSGGRGESPGVVLP
jgi:hypothetical protein